jgi:hypothetical protein
VETRVQRVGATVEAFQAEMDEFFQRLLAEQDPTRIATMAETMPEPPDLAGLAASITEADLAPSATVGSMVPEADVAPETVEPTADPVSSENTEVNEAEAAMAARLDFAAAEAEAATFTGDLDIEYPSGAAPEAEAPATDPNVITGLANADAGSLSIPASAPRVTSRVVVVGLVSVASIATFKRGLTRSAGVSAVAVASGPDGEFIFTVEHGEDVKMADAVTSLEGFGAQVTGETDGVLQVTAHDPDPGS